MAYESLQYKKHIKIDTIRDSYARTVTSSTKSDDSHFPYREYRRETSDAPSVALEDSMLTISFLKTDVFLSWIIELRVRIPKLTDSFIPQWCDLPNSTRDNIGIWIKHKNSYIKCGSSQKMPFPPGHHQHSVMLMSSSSIY